MTKKKSLFEDEEDGSSSSSSSSSEDGGGGEAGDDGAAEDHRKKEPKQEDKNNNDDQKEEDKIQINKRYAHEFTSRKQKEELRRVRFEQGGGSDDGSSSSEEEDDGAALLTPQLDVNILKTIRAVRTKDKSIYDPQVRFFDDGDVDEGTSDEEDSGNKKSKSSKPKRYKDVVREQVLEEMEKDDDAEDNDEDDDADPTSFSDDNHRMSRLAYDTQQQEFRKAFLDSTKIDSDSDDDDGDDEVLVKRKKGGTKADDDKMQKELLEEIERIKATVKTDDDNHKLVDPRGEVEDGETFLLDYFKNRPWMEKADESSDEDSYSDEDRKLSAATAATKTGGGDDADDDASLQELEEADDFEAQYNFRFEQAVAATATSGAEHSLRAYARTMDTTLRRKDESRAEKRHARKERKAAERQAKEERLKRLKNAKRQELEEKLLQVKSVLGEVEGRGQAVDEAAIMKLMEGDFDPEKFEELMKETYNDDFYEQEDEVWKNDAAVRESLKLDEDGNLLVGGDDEDGGLYDNLEEDDMAGETCEEGEEEEEWPDEYEEANYEEEDEKHLPEESELERKLKAKVEDELYKLDYEDIVAGMPTRFKYRQVEPNSYGLSTEEILFARDSTLKQFVSLKKMAPYVEQEHFVGSKKRRRFRDMLKHDLEEELGNIPVASEDKDEHQNPEDEEEAASVEKKKKKRRRLKKGSKNKESSSGQDISTERVEQACDDDENAPSVDPEPKPKRKRRKKSKSLANTIVVDEPAKKEGEAGSGSAVEQVADSSTKKKHHEKKKHKKAKRKKKVEGVTESRLASYGL